MLASRSASGAARSPFPRAALGQVDAGQEKVEGFRVGHGVPENGGPAAIAAGPGERRGVGSGVLVAAEQLLEDGADAGDGPDDEVDDALAELGQQARLGGDAG